jgi:hypothetical protein
MLDQEVWEEAVKAVRLSMLERKTRDPHDRRIVAAIIDAFCDNLYEELKRREMET